MTKTIIFLILTIIIGVFGIYNVIQTYRHYNDEIPTRKYAICVVLSYISIFIIGIITKLS